MRKERTWNEELVKGEDSCEPQWIGEALVFPHRAPGTGHGGSGIVVRRTFVVTE